VPQAIDEAGRHLRNVLDRTEDEVVLQHGEHLVVRFVAVDHAQPADRAGPDPAAGERRLVNEQQRVGVVAVARARVGDEAVVEVVVDGRRQDAVEAEDAGGLVVLVLVPAAARNLDDDLDHGREIARARAHRIDLPAIAGV